MSFYLSNFNLHPTGVEPAEFIDLPPIADHAVRAATGAAVDRGDARMHPDGVAVTIVPLCDGPLVIDGAMALAQPDGTTERAVHLRLCRCGRSGSKPSCDDTHARVGFRAPGVRG
jgi:Iron-binding zinc finger CDGSH type